MPFPPPVPSSSPIPPASPTFDVSSPSTSPLHSPLEPFHPDVSSPSSILPPSPALRKSSRQYTTLFYLKDYICQLPSFSSSSSLPPVETEPFSYSQATSVPAWQDAMNKKFDAVDANRTWDIVPPPSGKKPIGCKWVYKIKYKDDGSVERYKARLVIWGDTQVEGVNFTETFSPVIKMSTVKCLVVVAIKHSWFLSQLYVNNAFLHGNLDEEVYMKLPQGLNISALSGSAPFVCKLRKSLYGLRHASRQWYAKLYQALYSRGYTHSLNDYSLVIKGAPSNLVLLAVYVDDIIITGDDNAEISALKQFLDAQFKIKDLGCLHYFLGIEVSTISGGVILNKKKFVSDLLQQFDCTVVSLLYVL